MKRNTNKIALFMLVIVFATATFAALPVNAAGGTNGKISISTDAAIESQTIVVKCYELDASSDYSLEVDDTAEFNWTTSSSETIRYLRLTDLPAGGSDGMVKIELVDGTATVIDTKYVQSSDPSKLVPESLLTTIFVAILVILVFAGIILGIKKGLMSG